MPTAAPLTNTEMRLFQIAISLSVFGFAECQLQTEETRGRGWAFLSGGSYSKDPTGATWVWNSSSRRSSAPRISISGPLWKTWRNCRCPKYRRKSMRYTGWYGSRQAWCAENIIKWIVGVHQISKPPPKDFYLRFLSSGSKSFRSREGCPSGWEGAGIGGIKGLPGVNGYLGGWLPKFFNSRANRMGPLGARLL